MAIHFMRLFILTALPWESRPGCYPGPEKMRLFAAVSGRPCKFTRARLTQR